MIEQLQFVRPDWFYAFIPLVLFIALMLRRHKNSLSWKSVCDEKLLPHVLTAATGKTSQVPLILAALATSFCIIAAAGPVFKKLPQPVFREQSALVILMDLSQSMDATDLRPSRLERAKLKLLDILKARKGGQTALVVYAAQAFVVTPLTDDTNTIANLVPTLATQLMPAQGSSAYLALEKASDLLQQAGSTQGDALLITDGLSNRDKNAIKTFSAQGHRLSILGVGTEEGSPIPLNGGFLQDSKGAIVIPKLRIRNLQQAALAGSGLYVSMQTDDSDIERLDTLFSTRRLTNETWSKTLGKLQLTADIWQEEGPWLLLLALPFAALWSRKGWLLCIPVIALSLPEPSYAFNVNDLWQSSDQQAMRAFKKGNTQGAAEQFENERWKSSAYYRAGDYEKSLDTLKEPASSDDFYNKGNALAKLGRYPEAIKAYDEAINLDENNEDAAYNREQIKQAEQEQQGKPSQDQQQEGDDNNEQQDKQQSSDNGEQSEQNQQSEQQKNSDASQQDGEKENKDGTKQDQQDSSQANEKSSEQQEPQENKASSEEQVQQALKDAQQQDQASEENNEKKDNETLSMNQNSEDEALSEDQQVTEQWLRRIPDDPGQLLRNKFQYQYKRMPGQVNNEQPW